MEIQNNHNLILVGRAIFHWSNVTEETMVFAKKVNVNLFSAQNQILKFMSYVTAGENPFVKYLVRVGVNNFYWYSRLGKETIDFLFG